MADSLANVALETLRDLLVEETKLLLSVSGEVDQVKRDMRIIHAMLMKADRRGSDSPTLKVYVDELRALALKAENVLETYAFKVASKKQGQSLKEKFKRYSCILCECSNVHEVGRVVRDIITRLADLTGKFESELGQESSRREEEEEDLARLTLAHEVEPHFVGMEKEIKDLVSMVKDERRRERVIKIYGMGGMGKTSVARKVYNHAELASYARAWACVTQNFQPKAFLGNILRQLENNEQGIDSMDVASLMDRVCRVLGKMNKSLLVIDDIWEDEHWEIIKKVVPTNCHVLLTTRNENIANQESHPYKLKLLVEDEGWDLLKKISLGLAEDEDAINSLEKIGRNIVVKCGHLPLSISVIGGILRQKGRSLAEWEKVNTSIGPYLRHGEGVEGYKRVKEVLELSYDALPYYLKSCFLYLACFPEDQDIKTERLYLLWMAEGFISHEDKGPNESLTDVAERYLSELAMRCMVQADKSADCSPLKKFDSCRLHDLMHDLCSSKAEKEKLLKRVEVSKISSPIVNSINRLTIVDDSDVPKLGIKGLKEVKDLRSFMLLGQYKHSDETVMINLERSPCLRILVVDDCEFEDGKLPKKVGKLIHLRYFSLRGSSLRELPKFVCGMPYLQTLDLRVSFAFTLRLRNEIWKMKKLKHLFLPEVIEVIGGEKLRLDGLEELETLEEIDSGSVCLADISKLMMSLRKLCVTVGEMDSMSTVLQVVSNKSRPWELNLVVRGCDLSREDVEKVLMFPGLSSLCLWGCNVSGGYPCYQQGMAQNLESFSVFGCKVSGEGMNMNVNVNVMEELGKYPILKTLYFDVVEFGNTETFVCPSNSFPQLSSLKLKRWPNIKKWEVEEGAMPKLVKIDIVGCRNMEKLPDGLRFISTLESLGIYNMPEEFNERVRGEDSATVSHIPLLYIDMIWEEKSNQSGCVGFSPEIRKVGLQLKWIFVECLVCFCLESKTNSKDCCSTSAGTIPT